MDQFSRWSGLAHSLISKHAPRIKLGHVHQLLAACLGHRTYASLRESDFRILNQKPHYVLFDCDAGLARARDLGVSLTEAQWREVTMALRPSGITPFWLTTLKGMNLAAQLTFEDSSDSRIRTMKCEVGFPNGQQALLTRCHSEEGELPEILRFDVQGEVYAFNDEVSLAIPVNSVVEFQRVGLRIYGDGALTSVERCGEPRPRDQDEEEYDGEYYGMSED